jgi:hypothetical protein
MPVIPAMQEAEIKRIRVQDQSRQKVDETPISVYTCNLSYEESIGIGRWETEADVGRKGKTLSEK